MEDLMDARMKPFWKRTGGGLVMGAVLLMAGCGAGDNLGRLEVQGTVNLSDGPLSQGRIAFLPIDNTPGPATGGPIENGRFHLPRQKGLVVGKHRVEIIATRPTGKLVEEGSGGDQPGSMVTDVEQFIPEEFNTRSKLVVEITPESSKSLEFVLDIPN